MEKLLLVLLVVGMISCCKEPMDKTNSEQAARKRLETVYESGLKEIVRDNDTDTEYLIIHSAYGVAVTKIR